MKTKLKKFNISTVFIISILVFLVPLIYYVLYWVPQQQKDLIFRYLRVTSMMSEQIETRGKNISTVLEEADIKLTTEDQSLRKNFEKQAASLLNVPANQIEAQLIPGKKEGFFSFDIHFNPSKDQLKFSIGKDILMDNEKARAEFTVHMDIEDYLAEVYRGKEFEDILLLNEKGEILYSHNQHRGTEIKSGLKMARLESLFQGKTSEEEATQLNKDDIHSYALDLEIAQSQFKLFLQPIPLNFVSHKESNRHWYLGGLLSSSTFDKRSRKISNTILLFFVLLLAAGFIGYPLIRLSLIGPGDSLRKRDVIFLLLSFAASIPVIISLFLSGVNHRINTSNNQSNMATLTNNIHNRFSEEVQKAYDQLTLLVKEKGKYLSQSNTSQDLLAHLEKDGKLVYPLFDMAYIMDQNGLQKYKQVPHNSPITFHDVSGRHYFKSIMDNKFWFSMRGMPMFMESVYSKSTGLYEINLSIPYQDPGEPDLAVAGISFRPLSVIDPVLPTNHGFAIIDGAGKVIFHSDLRLNAKENFFAECSDIGLLEAAIRSRARDHLSLTYQGEKREICVMPIKNIPWTLVVFQDSEIHGSRNLEKIYRSGLRYFLYLLLVILLVFLYLIICRLQKKSAGPGAARLFQKFRWLWPDKNLRLKYTGIALVNFLLFLLLLFQLFISETPFHGSLTIPFLVLVLVYIIIHKALFKQYPVTGHISNRLLTPIVARILVTTTLLIALTVLFIVFKNALFAIFLDIKSLILIPLVLYIYILFLPGETGNPNLAKSWFYRNSHTLVIHSLLLLVIAYPTLMFYNMSHQEERLAYAKFYQASLARNFIQWQNRYKKNYPAHAAFTSQNFLKHKEHLEDKGVYTLPDFETIMVHESLGRFQLENVLNQNFGKPLQITTDISSMYSGILLFISKIIPFDNNYSEKIRYYYHDSSADSAMMWKHTHTPTKENLYFKYDEKPNLPFNLNENTADPLWIFSKLPRLRGQTGNTLLLTASILLLFLFLTLVLYALIAMVSRFIFLTEIHVNPEESTVTSVDQVKLIPGLHLLYPVALSTTIDLCGKDDCLLLDGRDKERVKQMAKTLSHDIKFFVFDHFDYAKQDSEFSSDKLLLLEELIYNQNINITLITRFEPLQYFELNTGKEDNKEIRWKQILTLFQSHYLVEKNLKGKSTIDLDNHRSAYFDNECGDAPYLDGIRNRIISTLKASGDSGNTGWKDRVYQEVRPVYEQVWRTCTTREKMVLIQLAKNGLLNIKNREIIRKLMNRGLIKQTPLRLMNETFKNFVLKVEDMAGILEWRRMQLDSNWAKIRRPFLFIVTAMILFLVFTQPDMLKSWLVWIPALSGAIPTVLRLFDNLSGAATPSE